MLDCQICKILLQLQASPASAAEANAWLPQQLGPPVPCIGILLEGSVPGGGIVSIAAASRAQGRGHDRSSIVRRARRRP